MRPAHFYTEPDVPRRKLTNGQLRAIRALASAPVEFFEDAPSYDVLAAGIGMDPSAFRAAVNRAADRLRDNGMPAKRRLFEWGRSPDGRAYIDAAVKLGRIPREENCHTRCNTHGVPDAA